MPKEEPVATPEPKVEEQKEAEVVAENTENNHADDEKEKTESDAPVSPKSLKSQLSLTAEDEQDAATKMLTAAQGKSISRIWKNSHRNVKK